VAHLNNPAGIPGNVALHTGSNDLGNEQDFSFSLYSNFAGPVVAIGGSYIDGLTGPIGGSDVWDDLLLEYRAHKQHLPPILPIPFQVAPDPITVNEEVATKWTDGFGNLDSDTSLITGAPQFPNPRSLAITWKPGQSDQDVSWEIQNRLVAESLQSQDFFAGVLAAVASTAALMALALLGAAIRDAILNRIR
jgi:hypothetical protein